MNKDVQKFKGAYITVTKPAVKSRAGDTKISGLPDGGSYQSIDLMAVARGSSNYKLTQAEVLAAVPSVAPGLGPFDGTIDNVGTLPNHYVNVGDGYTASPSKTYDNTTANITETASISMTSADQLYVQIGQNNTWNLDSYTITGSTGNAFSVEFSDASSVWKYTCPESAFPVTSFDANSTTVIRANGGVIKNTSANDNSYIYCAGTLLADDVQFLLPNASYGGFKTDLYTNLNDIIFTGGGTNCDTAWIANGGKIANIIVNGNNWKSNAFINTVTNVPTIHDTLYVDINAPVSMWVNGVADKIFTNPLNTSGQLSLNMSSNSTLVNSYADSIILTHGVVNNKFGMCTLGTVSYANDNTTTAKHVGVTFLNNVQIYGTEYYNTCEFQGGVEYMVGSTPILVGCTSATAAVNHGAATLIRAGNDANIGNDYLTDSAVLMESGTSAKISAMPAEGAALTTDILPVVSAGINKTVTVQDIIDITPGGAASILMEGGASAKISAMPHFSALSGPEKFPLVHDVSGTPTNAYCTLTDILSTINFNISFIDAAVDSWVLLQSALTSGAKSVICYGAFTTPNAADITLSHDTLLWFANDMNLDMGAFVFNPSTSSLKIRSTNNNASLSFTTQASTNLFSTSGTNIFDVDGVNIVSNGSATNCSLCPSANSSFKNMKITLNAGSNSGLETKGTNPPTMTVSNVTLLCNVAITDAINISGITVGSSFENLTIIDADITASSTLVFGGAQVDNVFVQTAKDSSISCSNVFNGLQTTGYGGNGGSVEFTALTQAKVSNIDTNPDDTNNLGNFTIAAGSKCGVSNITCLDFSVDASSNTTVANNVNGRNAMIYGTLGRLGCSDFSGTFTIETGATNNYIFGNSASGTYTNNGTNSLLDGNFGTIP